MIKYFMLNVTLDIAYIICVTKAAMHFNNPKILFWYFLVLVLEYSFKVGRNE